MKKFLSLLDPRISREGSGITVGQKQALAQQQFPELVAQSPLRLYEANQGWSATKPRFLITLAPSFSMEHLRFLDLLTHQLSVSNQEVSVYLLNILDLDSIEQLRNIYSCHSLDQNQLPIVGYWDGDLPPKVSVGPDAINFVFCTIKSILSYGDVVKGLRPFDPKLLE